MKVCRWILLSAWQQAPKLTQVKTIWSVWQSKLSHTISLKKCDPAAKKFMGFDTALTFHLNLSRTMKKDQTYTGAESNLLLGVWKKINSMVQDHIYTKTSTFYSFYSKCHYFVAYSFNLVVQCCIDMMCLNLSFEMKVIECGPEFTGSTL